MIRKNVLILPIAIVLSLMPVSGVDFSEQSWRILEQAQVQFDSGSYGEALSLADKAASVRRAEAADEYRTIDTAIASAEVRRRAGDNIDNVISVLKDREQKTAVDIIEKYLSLFGKNRYNNNIHNLLEWIKNKSVYPEADYLSGKIYQLEGEYKTALDFYSKAYSEREYLDIPDSQYEILYSMVFLAKLTNDDGQLEKMLLLILSDDDAFNNNVLKTSMIRTVRADKAENVDRFFLLYRADSKFSLRALHELGVLYSSRNENEDALFCFALGAIQALTHVIDVVKERDSSFQYVSLSAFLTECGKHDDILVWADKNNVWEMMYLFAKTAGVSGYKKFSAEFFSVLARYIPDDYFKELSALRL